MDDLGCVGYNLVEHKASYNDIHATLERILDDLIKQLEQER
jgi:hypothetical protein